LGARTRRAGLSKFFVGYKKHTLRLWLRAHQEAVLLVPLISWVAPAHLPEGYLLEASVRECQRRLAWRPDIIVGDLAYIRQEVKKAIRQKYGVAILTKMKPDMNLIDAFDTWNQMSCLQGQPLHWLGYDPSDQSHWFGPQANAALCLHCWEARQCPREFAYRAELHETLLGLLPLNTRAAARLLGQVRCWIEPTQAYDKNLLGLKRMFLNSLRLSWTLSLLADAVVLLRALALMSSPNNNSDLLRSLRPTQLDLPLDT
jgi:hypothetical protein